MTYTKASLLLFLMLVTSCSANGRQLISTHQLTTLGDSGNSRPHQLLTPQGTATSQAVFSLSSPTDGATNLPLELKLSWTEADGATHYILQLADDSSFSQFIINETVQPSATAAQGEFDIKKKNKLKTGTTYFWRVYAVFPDQSQRIADRSPSTFRTTAGLFAGLASKGFKLQKALSGPDKGELAEVSFLNTIGQNTVYSTTFALSWQSKRFAELGNTNVALQASVEGALSSDDSESEDAWRFKVSGVFSTSFVRCQDELVPCPAARQTDPFFSGLYTKASLKYEADRDFKVKKLSGEFYTTPSSFRLAMGTARPISPSKPIQFQWRPFFRVDVGHTFRRGGSAEKNDTIFRLVPRARAVLNLQFLRRALNMDDVNIFADETFYHLPLEDGKRKFNFLMTGIEFHFTPNLGFGLTYKTGSSAPTFQKINTLQGVFGIRF
ncbi:MAG TPA: hypothetical protein VN643_24810 [Pyrinomonadaceae bacterium]|nr:hypothetical protein [Pyrinomonadaceae bacterium]